MGAQAHELIYNMYAHVLHDYMYEYVISHVQYLLSISEYFAVKRA